MSSTIKNSRRFKKWLFAMLGLLSVVRGYNLLVIFTAQYFTSIFIFSPEKDIEQVLFDPDLFKVVVSTMMVIAAGYIINGFYDFEQDRINRPYKTKLDRMLSANHKMNLYFTLNLMTLVLASTISWRAFLFFTAYIFGIWLYSHKLKKMSFWGLLSVTSLTLMPFFVLFVYHKHFSGVVLIHASFLTLLLMIRELIKDLVNIRGTFAQNIQTIPVKYDEGFTKRIILFLSVLTLLPIALLLKFSEIGYMVYYFYGVPFFLLALNVIVLVLKRNGSYSLAHNLVKLILVLGVLSLVLIDEGNLLLGLINKMRSFVF